MSRGSFRLEKWYLDVVADDGEVFIGYAAKLRHGLLRLHCGALLHALPGGKPRSATQLTGLALPEDRGGVLHWTGPAHDGGRAHGTWTPEVAGPELLLLDGPDGAVRWHGAQLRSAVRLALPGGRTLAGLGYAERMELTIAPWLLPLRELRWGRFTSPGAALAWIDWRGSHPLTLVLDACTTRTAQPVAGATVGDDAIVLPDGRRLSFDERVTLRDGTLGGSALQSVPLLRAVLPPALLGTRETKWLSRGTLARAGGPVERGWVIHEVVRFPAAIDRGGAPDAPPGGSAGPRTGRAGRT